MESPSNEQLYKRFETVMTKQKAGAWILALFEGSPQDSAYSWCPDCVAASEDVRSFLASYKGHVRFVQFKVGSKEEWEGRDKPNPFRERFPHVSDLPTAILFRGKLDVARISIPQKHDLAYLCERAEAYDGQIREGAWHPPRGFG
jgi:hypothetical protein